MGFPLNPGFNVPPYSLGTFDTIATYKAGRYGRDDSFSIGFSDGEKGAKDYRKAIGTYRSDAGDLRCTKFHVSGDAGSVEFAISESSFTAVLRSPSRNGKKPKPIEVKVTLPDMAGIGRKSVVSIDFLYAMVQSRMSRRESKTSRSHLWYMRAVSNARPPYRSCYSYAPIRSKPRRTYDELSEDYNPEGAHIPSLLARLLRQERNSAESRRVREALRRFGTESGLFRTIDVKRLGRKVTDPFQLQVSVSGPAVNLTDVGYGVSQALPILVQSVLRTSSDVLLMQQPEVHLHPRAQAALGTFFAGLVADGKRVAVIETHSDHLVDRVRQEVATGSIDRDRVQILFFHKPKLETTVHSITLDKFGNVENAPPEYRRFFLDEEVKLFNRTSR